MRDKVKHQKKADVINLSKLNSEYNKMKKEEKRCRDCGSRDLKPRNILHFVDGYCCVTRVCENCGYHNLRRECLEEL